MSYNWDARLNWQPTLRKWRKNSNFIGDLLPFLICLTTGNGMLRLTRGSDFDVLLLWLSKTKKRNKIEEKVLLWLLKLNISWKIDSGHTCCCDFKSSGISAGGKHTCWQKKQWTLHKRKGLGLLKSYSGFGLKSETTFTSALDGETFPTIQIETSLIPFNTLRCKNIIRSCEPFSNFERTL